MLSTTLQTYGGPYVDRTPVKNPQAEMSSSKGNRLMEDVAQLTRTGYRAVVEFLANASGNPAAADVTHESMWGNGDAQKPTVTRTGAGLYTITYASSFVDGVSETESVAFRFGRVSCRANTNTVDNGKVKTIASNVITIAVFSAGALSDLGGTGYVTVWLR